MSKKREKQSKNLSIKEYLIAVVRIAKITFVAAPFAALVQLLGAIVTAILPIITTYFAALTTTALADSYAGNPDAGAKAVEYVIITAVLGITMTAWTSVESYITQLMRYKVEAAMSDRMYEHFLSLEFWRYDDKETADLYDRATKFAGVFPYVFDRLASLMTAVISMVAGLIALVLVNWWLGVIILVAIAPGIYIQFKLSRIQAEHWNKNVETRRARSIIEYGLFQQPKHIAELRIYGMIRHLLDLRMDLRNKDEKDQIEFERRYIIKRLGADSLEAVAEVAALLFTVFQIINKQQPVGQFLYVQQIVSRALSGANSFVSQLSTIDQDLANLFDYQRFMELPIRDNEGYEIKDANVVTFQHVSFSYPNSDALVLDDVSLTIKKGQHIAIVGENGAGKSTFIKLLLGLYAPTKGKITIDGVDLRNISLSSWHKTMGVLQQDFLSYRFATVRENILFGDVGGGVDESRYEQAIDRAEARTFINKLYKKADSYVSTWMAGEDGKNGIDLSGGQWQRLALARNFYRDSPIIILDEPTSAIDALAESRIFKHLFADKTKTVITISHRLTTVEKADCIYMFEDGRLVEYGKHDDLVRAKGAYYTMFESQIK